MKLMRGDGLIRKEIRQNWVVPALFSLFPGVVLFANWVLGQQENRPPFEVTDWQVRMLVYCSAFAIAATLGAGFLAEENGTRATNFLLRLPLTRRQVFFLKILSHCLILAAGVLIATAVGKACAACFAARASDEGPIPEELRVHLQWIPLIYFMAVCASVLVDRWLTAVLSTLGIAALVALLTRCVGLMIGCLHTVFPEFDEQTALAQLPHFGV